MWGRSLVQQPPKCLHERLEVPLHVAVARKDAHVTAQALHMLQRPARRGSAGQGRVTVGHTVSKHTHKPEGSGPEAGGGEAASSWAVPVMLAAACCYVPA